jgi:hypothetical protein
MQRNVLFFNPPKFRALKNGFCGYENGIPILLADYAPGGYIVVDCCLFCGGCHMHQLITSEEDIPGNHLREAPCPPNLKPNGGLYYLRIPSPWVD